MLQQSHLYHEIHEQPASLNDLLDQENEAIRQLADAIKRRQISHVIIAARGTSDNAGRYAKYLLGAVNGLIVALATPSLFTVYEQPPPVWQRAGNRHQSERQESGHYFGFE